MDTLLGYSGLSIAFIIIIALHLYFIIYSKVKVITKVIIIPTVLWYSLILFNTPGKLMGWPVPDQLVPENSRILSKIIREPFGDDLGAIYLLTVNYSKVEKKSFIQLINLKHIFGYNEKYVPRLYELPYSRDLHRRLNESLKEAKNKGGLVRVGKRKMDKKIKSRWKKDNRLEIEVVDPKKLMPK